MPAPKSLRAHVVDATFRARLAHHRDLLESSPTLPWPALALLQARYVATDHPLERRALAVGFERQARALAEDEVEITRREAELAELDALVDGEPVELNLEQLGRDIDRSHQAVWARSLRREGMSLRAIAEQVGVSRSTVTRMLATLDS